LIKKIADKEITVKKTTYNIIKGAKVTPKPTNIISYMPTLPIYLPNKHIKITCTMYIKNIKREVNYTT